MVLSDHDLEDQACVAEGVEDRVTMNTSQSHFDKEELVKTQAKSRRMITCMLQLN